MVMQDGLAAWLPGEDKTDTLGGEAIPGGNYPALVTDVEAKTSSKGGWMWALVLEINDGGQHQGKKLFYNMNWTDAEGDISGGIGFTQLALRALGLAYVSSTGQIQAVNFVREDVVGKQVLAIVTIQSTGQYAGRNSVERLEPLMAVAPAAGAPPAAQVPPAAKAAPVAQIAPAAQAAPVAVPPGAGTPAAAVPPATPAQPAAQPAQPAAPAQAAPVQAATPPAAVPAPVAGQPVAQAGGGDLDF